MQERRLHATRPAQRPRCPHREPLRQAAMTKLPQNKITSISRSAPPPPPFESLSAFTGQPPVLSRTGGIFFALTSQTRAGRNEHVKVMDNQRQGKALAVALTVSRSLKTPGRNERQKLRKCQRQPTAWQSPGRCTDRLTLLKDSWSERETKGSQMPASTNGIAKPWPLHCRSQRSVMQKSTG